MEAMSMSSKLLKNKAHAAKQHHHQDLKPTQTYNMQQHAPSWPSTVHRVILTNLWRRTNATIWRERVSGCDQLATATRVSLVSHHFSHTPRNDVASYQKSTSINFPIFSRQNLSKIAVCRYPTNVLVIRFGYNHYMQPHSPCLSSLQLVQRLHVPFGLVNLCSQCLKQLCSVATWIKKLMLILKLFTCFIICFRKCWNSLKDVQIYAPMQKVKSSWDANSSDFDSHLGSKPMALRSLSNLSCQGVQATQCLSHLCQTRNWKTLFTSQIPRELPGVPAPSSTENPQIWKFAWSIPV